MIRYTPAMLLSPPPAPNLSPSIHTKITPVCPHPALSLAASSFPPPDQPGSSEEGNKERRSVSEVPEPLLSKERGR